MTGRAIFRGAALAAALALPLSAAATTITIVNVDSPGVGFNDTTPRTPVGGNNGTTLGEQRLNVFKYAAAFWAERLDSPVEILVRASFEAKTCSATSAILGSAGTKFVQADFVGAPRPATWYSSALANKLAGSDLCPTSDSQCGTGEDINASFTTALDDGSCAFPKKWYYGLDAQPTAGTTDFATVVIHELGHGLGFQSFVGRTTGAKFESLDDAFMVNLYDATTGKTWDQMTDAERLASTTNTTNLLWNGPAVVAAASGLLQSGIGVGGRPQMYAPNPSESGSSTSHWDTTLYPNEIMEPTYTIAQHKLLITGQLMNDLGWSLASGTGAYKWLLPSSAKVGGSFNADWSTALFIGNRGSAEAHYTMKFLGNNADGTTGPESASFTLGPNQSVTYEDVLGSVFSQVKPAYGAILVSADQPTLNVLGQTSTPVNPAWGSCVSSGAYGQSVPAAAAADLISAGTVRSIVGIRNDSAYRTNLILANAGTSPVTVDGTLLSSGGAVLGTLSWTLPPLGMTQGTAPLTNQMGISAAVRDAQLLLSTATAGGSFAAYASVIDNSTNDPRTLLPK